MIRSDLFLEQPERVGVREHQAGDVVVHECGERVRVDQPSRVGGHRDGLEPPEAHARGVRAVRRLRDQDLPTHGPLCRVVRAHDQQPGELPAGARGRLQRRAGHPGDLAEGALQAPQELEGSLCRGVGLERMEVGEARECRCGLRDLRVVLHRARAERVHARVDPVVLLREARVVRHEVALGELGQVRGRGAAMDGGHARLFDVERRERPCAATRAREVLHRARSHRRPL